MRSSPEPRMWTLFAALTICVLSCVDGQYQVPKPTLEVLKPSGFRVSIPDSEGVQLIAFHGNINKPMKRLEAGEVSVDVTSKTGNEWVYVNSDRHLEAGDVVNFWIYVIKDGLGYHLDDQSWMVPSPGNLGKRSYEVPKPTLEVLHPSGFRVSIPDEEGVRLMAFHGNVNKPMKRLEAGEVSVDVTSKIGNEWVYVNSDKHLEAGDVVNFWIYVIKDGLGYHLDDQSWKVPSPGNLGKRSYEVPKPTLEVLHPSGFRVSIPDKEGVRLMAFHGNINKPMKRLDGGEVSVDVTSKTGNQWVYTNTDKQLKTGDVVNFWIYVIKDGLGYHLDDQTWKVSGDPEVTPNKPENRGEKLVWADEFDTLNFTTWSHLVTAWDGGNREFEYYRNDRRNSFVSNGVLTIRPTATVDEYDENFLETGTINNTDCNKQPCASVAGDDIVSPYFSARLSSHGFSFRYGRVEIKAKMPKGDWLWPALWMLPQNWKYGDWPRSGEIDIAEVRCNPDLRDPQGGQHGYNEVLSTLHFGPTDHSIGGAGHADSGHNFADGFHIYGMTWTKDSFSLTVDGKVVKSVNIPDGGFPQLGGFPNDIYKNGGKDAPFDDKFYFILNVAIGGNFFPKDWTSSGRKRPWDYGQKGPKRQFWSSRSSWAPTWGDKPEDHSMQVDYIRVYQQDN